MTTRRLAALLVLASASYATVAPAAETRVRPPQQDRHHDWYFGMTVRLKQVFRNGRMTQGLKVTHVRRHGPADKAGLEPGDIIVRANGTRFDWARGDHDGVRLLQESVNSGGGVPTNNGGGAVTFVQPRDHEYGHVVLKVLDIRRPNRTVAVDVHPEHRGHDDGGIETFRRR